jgi:hypothetical protein
MDRLLKYSRDLEDVVTFVIGQGEEKKTFIVHKAFACHYSPVLEIAFSSGFIEGETQTYSIADTQADAFELFVEWLYTQAFKNTSLQDAWNAVKAQEENQNNEELNHQQLRLVEVWILGQKFLVPELQNLALEALVPSLVDSIPYSIFAKVYENTTAGSPLRRLIVDGCSSRSLSGYANHPDVFPRELLLDILIALQPHQRSVRMTATNYYVET